MPPPRTLRPETEEGCIVVKQGNTGGRFARKVVVKRGKPSRDIHPRCELPNLPKLDPLDFLEQQPVLAAVVADWRSKICVRQHAICLDLPAGVVHQPWLDPTSPPQFGPSQILEEEL